MNSFDLTKEISGRYPLFMVILLIMSILGGFLEAIGISMIFPIFSSILGGGGYTEGKLSEVFEAFNLLSIGTNGLLMLLSSVFLLKGIIKYYIDILIPRISLKIEMDVRGKLMNYMLDAKWSVFQKNNSGAFINVLNKESQGIITAIKYLCRYISVLGEILILLAISIFASPIIVFLGVSIGLIFVFSMKQLIVWTQLVREEWLDIDNSINSISIENVENAKFIKGMGLNKRRYKLFHDLLIYSGVLRLRIERYKALINAYQEPVAVIVISGIVYYLVNYSSLAQGDAFASLILLYRITGKIMALQGSKRTLVQSIPSVDTGLKYISMCRQEKEERGNDVFDNIKQDIVFERVSFSYTKTSATIDNVNLVIRKQEVVALVGGSGGGKTTLVDLFMGFIQPKAGKILIDGVDIQKYSLASLRSKVGYVPQESVLFNDSIFNNIAIGCTEACSKEKIITAAKLAHAHDFILKAENGYETLVGDRGICLSGGQRQRIALARALVRSPDILVLDEATSALDNESERQIQKVLNDLKGTLTIIIIAHRFTTIRSADWVYYIEKGKVIEEGDLDSLLASDNKFSRLYHNNE